jgi:hypothetical protein
LRTALHDAFLLQFKLVVFQVGRVAFTVHAKWHSPNFRRDDLTYVIVDLANAVVVCVADVDLYVSFLFIVKTRNPARFVERTLESRAVFYFGLA